MRKLLFLALMAMMALVVFAPAALAQDDDVDDNGVDDDNGVAAPAPEPLPDTGGHTDDDNGVDDDNGAVAPAPQQPLPDTSGGAVPTDDDDDNGVDDDNGAVASGGAVTQMPDTGGPALLPIAGLLVLLSAASVGIGAVTKRRRGR